MTLPISGFAAGNVCALTEDEAEDGALEEADYAVGEEEVMQDANLAAQQEGIAQIDRAANGSAQPDGAEDDRYVATAYSEGEEQDDRLAFSSFQLKLRHSNA